MEHQPKLNPVYFKVQAYGAILLDLRVGIFLEKKKKKEEVNLLKHNLQVPILVSSQMLTL